MRLLRTRGEVRESVAAARAENLSVGFVPTMGAFHDGHLALMREAKRRAGFVVVSLFVNPMQFNDPGDLARYPRDEARDGAAAAEAGVDVLFAPDPAELYPPGFATAVSVESLSEPLEGASRGPGHFRGVATVVAKLLNIVRPDYAFFGQKDAQQALIVERMACDLDFETEIVVCPTVREPDGLAMSSRNALLPPGERPRAAALSQALFAVEQAVRSGVRDPEAALEAGRAVLLDAGLIPEYFAIVDAVSLQAPDILRGELLVVIAAKVGGVRLIDNLPLRLP
jgi:pantoate--beta-alanine ligase